MAGGDSPRPEMKNSKKCDHTSVGILVWRDNKLLLIERKRGAIGFAPPAGHVDGDSSFEEAARRELKEEVGLEAEDLRLLTEGKKENQCRREDGGWHYWKVYQAEARGEVERSEEETKQASWFDKEELRKLAERTSKYLAQKIPEDEWMRLPGIEPVWYEWFKELKII